MNAAPPVRLTVEQILRRLQATSYTEELDLSYATDLTPQVLQALAEMMPSLQKLNVLGTGLRELPDGVCRLRELRELNASNNALTHLPASIVSLTQLQHLNVARNQLVDLPASFGGLPALRLLNANNNQFAQLPANFGGMSDLRVLRLGANKLTSLPSSFAKLVSLRLLQLGHNQLAQFPSALARLQRLSVLDLSFNLMAVLPEFLRNMSALATLNVTGNPLREVPQPLSLPRELRITGIYSALDGAAAPGFMLPEATQPSQAPAPMVSATAPGTRPDFHGPQGQLDVTGIFLAGLMPGDNDSTEVAPPAPPGKKP